MLPISYMQSNYTAAKTLVKFIGHDWSPIAVFGITIGSASTCRLYAITLY